MSRSRSRRALLGAGRSRSGSGCVRFVPSSAVALSELRAVGVGVGAVGQGTAVVGVLRVGALGWLVAQNGSTGVVGVPGQVGVMLSTQQCVSWCGVQISPAELRALNVAEKQTPRWFMSQR